MSQQNNNGTEKTKNKKAETKVKEKLSGKARTKTEAKAKADIAPDISKKEVRSLLAENFSSKGTDEEVGSDHRGRGLTRGEKRLARDAYLRRKAQVFEIEQDNHKMLILFRASDTSKNTESQFYILGGNSAIIFAGDIGEKLGRTPKLRSDMDNGEYKFENGVVFVRNIRKLMAELEKIGLKRQKLSKQWADDEIVCYKLKREYTDAEIRGILKEREAELERCDNIIFPKVVYPEVHKYIITICDYAMLKVLKMDKS